MKLTFRDLKKNNFVIEAEPTELISDVKQKIEKEKGIEAAQQKLIYSGKILQDAHTVESYKIEEKGFIVVMVSKPKPAPAAAPAAVPATPAAPRVAATPAAPAAPQAAAPSSTTVPATPTPAGASSGTPALDTPAGQQSSLGGDSGPTMGTQREAAIQNLIGMGFDRPSVEAAMRAAYYNADRAVEYLMDGIPESVQREVAASGSQRHAPAAPAGASQDAPTTAGADDSGNVNLFEAAAQAERSGNAGAGAGALGADAPPGGLGNLDWLRSNPQFQQLRQVVQQQPQMLEPILQSVGAGNPQLAQLIGQNPNEFLQLLGERAEDGDVLLPPGATSISVTPEEQQAIDRLIGLGFDRDLAIQAYFACDKNEELAANFLFDQPDDEDDN